MLAAAFVWLRGEGKNYVFLWQAAGNLKPSVGHINGGYTAVSKRQRNVNASAHEGS